MPFLGLSLEKHEECMKECIQSHVIKECGRTNFAFCREKAKRDHKWECEEKCMLGKLWYSKKFV